MERIDELRYNVDDFQHIGSGDFIIIFQGNIIPVCVADNSEENREYIINIIKEISKSFISTRIEFDAWKTGLEKKQEPLTIRSIVQFLYGHCANYPKLLFCAVDEDDDGELCLVIYNTNYDVIRSKEMHDFLQTKIGNYFDVFYINDERFTRKDILDSQLARNNKPPLAKRLYHGTCAAYAQEILKHGLRSNETNSIWKVHNKGYVFLTSLFTIADDYAKLYSNRTKTPPVVIEIDSAQLNENNIVLDYDFISSFSNDYANSPFEKHHTMLPINSFFEGDIVVNSKPYGSQFAKLGYRGIISPSAIIGVSIKDCGEWKHYTKQEFIDKYIMKKIAENKNRYQMNEWRPDFFDHELPPVIKLYHGTNNLAMQDIVEDGVISAKRGHSRGETRGVNWFSTELKHNFGTGTIFSIEVPQTDFEHYKFVFMNEGQVTSRIDEIPIDKYNLRIEELEGVPVSQIYDIYKKVNGDIWELEVITTQWDDAYTFQLYNPAFRYVIEQEYGKEALKEYYDFMNEEAIDESRNKKKHPVKYVRQDIMLNVVGGDAGAMEEQINEVSSDDISLKSFDVQEELHPKIWINGKINSRVRTRLLDIANDFIDELEVKWVKPSDIVFTGSLANYNWSKYSDIDVHVIIDFSKVYKKTEFVEDYFDSKRKLWNEIHDTLKIYGFPVEMYVEDVDADTKSSGIYSLKTNKWIKEPKDLNDASLNQEYIKDVAAKYMTQIEDIEDDLKNCKDDKKLEKLGKQAKRLFDKLRDKRQKGLNTKAQEMSSGNIIWKVMRREKYIERLANIIKQTYDKMKSLD